MLGSINDDVVQVFQNALSIPMNQMCYCKRPLTRARFNRPFPDWRCKSCFAIQSRRVVFQCSNDKCLFKRHSGWIYRVCPSCFEWTEYNNFCEETDEKEDMMENTFIYRKINRCINMISYDYLYFRVWQTTAFEAMKLIHTRFCCIFCICVF